jgi:hypothetical protein
MPASRCGRSGKFFHAELRRRGRDAGAAVGEYRAREPDGYGYTRFCDPYGK